MRAQEIKRRFEHSVTLLQARDFDAAVAQLHRVLELAPQMPEAHANMGFAMIGIQRYAAARDFFNAATELNVNQLNAYFGLALALEGLNDLPGAMGAMQTYMHLSRADDPFRAKAENALQKWRASARPAPN
jgi:tetratricopeptide (TPR) repeat protein